MYLEPINRLQKMTSNRSSLSFRVCMIYSDASYLQTYCRMIVVLHTLDSNLVANLAVVVWEVDYEITSQSSTLAIWIADNSHIRSYNEKVMVSDE